MLSCSTCRRERVRMHVHAHVHTLLQAHTFAASQTHNCLQESLTTQLMAEKGRAESLEKEVGRSPIGPGHLGRPQPSGSADVVWLGCSIGVMG